MDVKNYYENLYKLQDEILKIDDENILDEFNLGFIKNIQKEIL